MNYLGLSNKIVSALNAKGETVIISTRKGFKSKGDGTYTLFVVTRKNEIGKAEDFIKVYTPQALVQALADYYKSKYGNG